MSDKKLKKELFLEKLKTDKKFNLKFGRKDVTDGKQVLPPCHFNFQCYTRELTLDERYELLDKMSDFNKRTINIGNSDPLELNNIPKRALSLQWSQRSVNKKSAA